MKPFNIEEYLANPNKKIVTGVGDPVRIICTNKKSKNYPIVALVQDRVNCETTYHYTIDGKWISGENSTIDLFFAPIKKEGWINLYKFNSVVVPGTKVYDTEEKAKFETSSKSEYYISTIKIEWEE